MNWSGYIHNTKDVLPRPLLKKGLSYVLNYNNALDFGAGGLRDTKELLKHNFNNIDVLDISTKTRTFANKLNDSRLNIFIKDFINFDYEVGKYDLINAQASLPFITKRYEKEVIDKLKQSLRKDGVFVGSFFGTEDEWNDKGYKNFNETIFHTKEEVLDLLDGLDIKIFSDVKYKGKIVNRNSEEKKWHLFRFVCIKL